MPSGQQVSFFGLSRLSLVAALLILLIGSCTIPKKYQANKPFVYKTAIKVHAGMSPADKQTLESQLDNQMDDSLKARTVLAIGIVPPFLYKRLSHPPVFDTLNVSRSKIFMNALLQAQGYFNPLIRDSFHVDTIRDQQRVNIRFDVYPGKQYKLDSTGFDLDTPELQQLAQANRQQSLLKKGRAFSLQLVSDEMDRLLGIFRNHGYYKITRQDLFAETDTVVSALIDPTLDPFEQARLVQELKQKQENPTINVVIKQRPVTDSSRIEKYYIGNITVYPDLSLLEDSSQVPSQTSIVNGYRFVTRTRKFNLRFISRNISLHPGERFTQDNYFRTINTFNRLGAWQNVDLSLNERKDSLPLLDADLRLYPAKKQSLNIDLDASRNVGDVLTTGQLFGTGINVKILNRNAYKESIQTVTNGRFGVELGKQLVQTIQANLAHSIYFPKIIAPFKISNPDSLSSARTNLSINAAYTNRRNFFEARSFNTGWGYEWTKRRNTWQYFPFNFEFTTVNKRDSLIKLENQIPSLKFAFNNGLIISQILGYNTFWTRGNKSSFLRARLEESGALFGLIRRLERGELRRFIKLEAEYKHFLNYSRSTLGFRMYGGYGYVYGRTGDNPEYTLPFFKAFSAGGPYSMRAWQVRQLGPGTSPIYDTTGGKSTDRFGNVQLEGNIEYRFNLATIAGIKIGSAFFTDIGNIWSKEFDSAGNNIPEAEFRLNKLYRDLAVAGGTGLRLDFDFFLIRLDWAYKLKDPLYADRQNGWFQHLDLGSGQFQLGIGYSF